MNTTMEKRVLKRLKQEYPKGMTLNALQVTIKPEMFWDTLKQAVSSLEYQNKIKRIETTNRPIYILANGG